MAELSRIVERLTAPLKRRVMLMIGRCVIEVVNDAAAIQLVQVTGLNGEVLDDVERFQNYGFTSVPLAGSEGVLAAAGGNRAHSFVIGVEDRRYRLTGLAGGEVAMHDDQGQKIVLYRDRVEIESAKIVLKSVDLHLGAEGGTRVARIGDMVSVTGGSSAGLHPIVEGSAIVRAA